MTTIYNVFHQILNLQLYFIHSFLKWMVRYFRIAFNCTIYKK